MKIWVLVDNRLGNTNQAIALAEELAGKYELITLQYNHFAKLPNFILKWYPFYIKKSLLHNIRKKYLPDIIITAGRRTAPFALYLKKKSHNKIKLVQIMQPCLPYNKFDAVILPYHDNAKPFSNIIRINGALNNIASKLAIASIEFQKHYPNLEKFIAVIIGGNNKKFSFDDKDATLFSALLIKISQKQQLPFFISFSRRTPESTKKTIQNNMPASTIIYDPKDENKSYNPYLGMLAKAEYIISTIDSISMCSEAVSTGKPFYVFCPVNFNSSKHKFFIKQLIEEKMARILDNSVTSLEKYNYRPLNEVHKVANYIFSKFR